MLHSFDHLPLGSTYIKVSVIFELRLNLPLHLGKVPRILGSFDSFLHEFFIDFVKFRFKLDIFFLDLLWFKQTGISDFGGHLSLGSEIVSLSDCSFEAFTADRFSVKSLIIFLSIGIRLGVKFEEAP